jgi:hypothetical protein
VRTVALPEGLDTGGNLPADRIESHISSRGMLYAVDYSLAQRAARNIQQKAETRRRKDYGLNFLPEKRKARTSFGGACLLLALCYI